MPFISEKKRKFLSNGALPTLNMPIKAQKSTNTRKVPKNRIYQKTVLYKSLGSFLSAAKVFTKKSTEWEIRTETENEICLVKNSIYHQHEFAVYVNNLLQVDVHHFGWPTSSSLAASINLSCTTVHQLICQIESSLVCKGINYVDEKDLKEKEIARHILTIKCKSFQEKAVPSTIQYAVR